MEKTNRLPEAIEHYQQASRLTPDDAEIWANLAGAYAGAGRTADAISAAQKAVELAQATGQTALIARMKDWLAAHAVDQPNSATAPPDR